MKLFDLFGIIFLMSYMTLTNAINNKSIEKVKRATSVSNSDCQNIASFVNQIGEDVNDCCGYYIECDEEGRITKM